MKRFFSIMALLLALAFVLASCDQPQVTVKDGYLVVNGVKTEHQVKTDGDGTDKDDAGKDDTGKDDTDVITVEDGYLVVNGVKTEHKVHTEPIITVVDGYVVVNGVKTEYEVNTADVITVEDGYVVVNGVKTEHKVHTEPIITVVDGFIAVNGVKTEHEVELACHHVWVVETTPPTCTEEGYDINTCSICEKRVRTNVVAARSHQFSTEYAVDGTHHWLSCGVCNETRDKDSHTPDDAGLCTVCQHPVADTPGVMYDLAGDGSYAEVVGYSGNATRVKIAAEYEGVPVTGIYNNAFQNTAITSVVIPDSVVSIGAYAFFRCYSLTTVTMGDGVTSIGDWAFYGCDSLTTVVIPDSVTSIGDWAFEYCDSLTTVEIPDSVTSIGDSAFYGCTSLTAVVIPDSVTSIGESAFYDCAESLYTEEGCCKYVKSGDNPYAVLIGVTNQNLSSYTIHERTKIIAGGAFSECERLTTVEIPDSVTSIGDRAFFDCDSLTTVVIPDSVTSIGDLAFSYCDSLTTVNYRGSAAEWVEIAKGEYWDSGTGSYTVVYNYTGE